MQPRVDLLNQHVAWIISNVNIVSIAYLAAKLTDIQYWEMAGNFFTNTVWMLTITNIVLKLGNINLKFKGVYHKWQLWKWNESGFRPPLCTYRLNWARRTSWGWWDDWDDTVLQTQDSKFKPWRSEAEHATSRSRRLPTILTFTRGWGRNIFVSFKPPRPGTEPRTLAWKAAVLTTTLGPPPMTALNKCKK